MSVPGVTAPVDIRFDEHDVPHIDAQSDADAFRALGVCHALNRFFQMDILRRVLRGRLAETIGDRKLGPMAMPPFDRDRTASDADYFMRALDLVPSARRVWEAGDAEGRHLLCAYVEGVNAAVPLLRRRRPLEHRAMNIPIRPWTPIDSILLAKGMAFGLSFKWRITPVFAEIADRLNAKPEHLDHILPKTPHAQSFAMTRLVEGGVRNALTFAPFGAPANGSNAFLVGAGRSSSGLPLLAGDPHLELSLPSIWYLASLRGSRYGAVGATLPGLPGVVLGRTRGMAWALTNGMIDDSDMWTEELDSGGTRYRVDGAWRPLRVETQEIKRKGRAPRIVRLRYTHRGPLFTDAFPGFTGPPLSMRMTLHEPADDMQSFLRLGRSQTVADALAAVSSFGSPAQNLLTADTQGNAAFRLMGKVPMRAKHRHPALPRDGTTSETDWRGFIAEPDLPATSVAPNETFISANNPQVDHTYPHYLSHHYEPDYRAERIAQLLNGRELSAADLCAAQMDAKNLCASRFRRIVLVPHAEAVRSMRPTVAPLLDRLMAWDGDERRSAPGAAPWHLVYHHLARRTFTPLLGADITPHWMSLINLLDEPLLDAFSDDDNPWAPPAVRATLLCEALDDAVKDMESRGLTLDSPWGAMHTLTLRHPAGQGPLATAFNRGPFAVDGGPFSVCSGQYLHARPGPVAAGASYRQVVDLARPEEGRMITFGGQSGYVGSRHYDDLTPRWLANDGLPMRLETELDAAQRLILTPGAAGR